MDRKQSNQMGGGLLIAIGLIVGPVVGLLLGQITIGLIAGFALGCAGVIALTIRDSRR